MSTTETPVWAAATPPDHVPGEPPKRTGNRIATVIIAIVAAIVLVGGGIAVALAVNGDSSNNAGTGTSGSAPGGSGGLNGPGGFGGTAGLSGALHGDFTATGDNGTYVTKRLQSGTVTAVGATAITAKSADGHSTTFVVGSSTTVDNGVDAIGDVKTGDTVTVVGTVSGDSATATSIVDSTLNRANGDQGFGNRAGDPPNQQAGSGS